MNVAWSYARTGDRRGTDYFNDLLSGLDDRHSDILGANATVPHGTPLTAENDEIAVRVNNAATQKEVDRAEVDATNSATVTMADGLGARLGQIYLDVLNAGELPKTSARCSPASRGTSTPTTRRRTTTATCARTCGSGSSATAATSMSRRTARTAASPPTART